MFFFVFRYSQRKRQIPLMIMLHIAYFLICAFSGLNSIYYERTFIFVVGMIWYDNNEILEEWITRKKHRWILIWISSCFLFLLSYLLSYYYPVFFRIISYFFLVPSVILLLMRIKIQNKVTAFFGNISLEIYVMQGIFLVLFHSEKLFINNPMLYILAVIVATIISSLILHPLIKLVYGIFRKKTTTNLSIHKS